MLQNYHRRTIGVPLSEVVVLFSCFTSELARTPLLSRANLSAWASDSAAILLQLFVSRIIHLRKAIQLLGGLGSVTLRISSEHLLCHLILEP